MDRKKKYDMKFVRKTIRFTQEEYEQIEKQRNKTRYSTTEFIRAAALKLQVTTELEEEMLYEINKIGVNLNQIAKAVNSKERIEVLKALLSIENQIKGLLNGS